jgi:hypothetical protein
MQKRGLQISGPRKQARYVECHHFQCLLLLLVLTPTHIIAPTVLQSPLRHWACGQVCKMRESPRETLLYPYRWNFSSLILHELRWEISLHIVFDYNVFCLVWFVVLHDVVFCVGCTADMKSRDRVVPEASLRIQDDDITLPRSAQLTVVSIRGGLSDALNQLIC